MNRERILAMWVTRERRRLNGYTDPVTVGDTVIDFHRRATYERVPWDDEAWWPGQHENHFAHVSKDAPNQIAFTQSPQHGEADRQTRMKPGKYLRRYFSDVLDENTIRFWAEKWNSLHDAGQLRLATTPDDIEAVYLNGPDSCMSKSPSYYCSHVHPVRVYGAGDLAVAYIGTEDGKATARCIVWPDKKMRSRIYGDEARLSSLLDAAGYDHGSMSGARLLRIESGDGLVCPYLDSDYAVTDVGDYLIIDNGGELNAQIVGGITETGEYCSSCGENVSGEFYYIQDIGESWCEGCTENSAFTCDHTGNLYSNDHGYVEVNTGRSWTETWSIDAIDNGEAFLCDACEEYHVNDRLAGITPDGESVCADCTADYFTCDDCGEFFHIDQYHSRKDGTAVCDDCYVEDEDEDAGEDVPARRCGNTEDLFAA